MLKPKSDIFTNAVTVLPARSKEAYAVAKALMIQYRDEELAEDYAVGGAGLNEELDQFPNPYVPPKGELLLGYLDGKPRGCIALRPLPSGDGEVMRMYVQPEARGNGMAEMLMIEIMTRATKMGYQTLYLDSLKKFKPAHRLYEKLGFSYCEPYDDSIPEITKENAVFMTKQL